MSIETVLPQVAALRQKVEEKAGCSFQTHYQFLQLVELLEKEEGEHMSESTLERIWEYSTRQSAAVSLRSLNVLAHYAGYHDWDRFCLYLRTEAGIESEMFGRGILSSSSLQVGDRLRIGWQPDRVCIIRYLGDNRFVAESTGNASMRPGDRFSCLQFQKGHELYLDHFCRADEPEPAENLRYAVGQRHGLTLLEKLSD